MPLTQSCSRRRRLAVTLALFLLTPTLSGCVVVPVEAAYPSYSHYGWFYYDGGVGAVEGVAVLP